MPSDDSPKMPGLPFLKKQMDDCDRPACDDTISNIHAAMNRMQASPRGKPVQCPPRSAELGNSSWTLLHAMAAWYPDKPSGEDKRLITGFYTALARFYPCEWCAEDFTVKLKEKPVEADSRKDLCMWLCEQHNLVNEKTGKPLFPCTMKNLDERWRKSSSEQCQSDH